MQVTVVVLPSGNTEKLRLPAMTASKSNATGPPCATRSARRRFDTAIQAAARRTELDCLAGEARLPHFTQTPHFRQRQAQAALFHRYVTPD